MTVMKKTEQKDDAVSPVVGVMLMLVVTIIIAAVVAAFATGLSSSTEAAPVASLTVKIPTENGVVSDFQIYHNSGDPIPTKDLKISFGWTGSDGTHYSHSYSALTDSGSASCTSHSKALYVIKNPVTYADDFGNVTLTAHYEVASMTSWDSGDGVMEKKALTEVFGDNYAKIVKGTSVVVTILHVPSGQLIYHDEVIAL